LVGIKIALQNGNGSDNVTKEQQQWLFWCLPQHSLFSRNHLTPCSSLLSKLDQTNVVSEIIRPPKQNKKNVTEQEQRTAHLLHWMIFLKRWSSSLTVAVFVKQAVKCLI
jgi:hypothetical protein